MKIFTAGYGGRNREGFLALMHDNGIRTVVDVRLRPDTARMGIWVKAKTIDKGLEKWLADSGVGYRSLVELGNVFMEFEDWRTPFRELLELSGELLTQRLAGIPEPWCLLCAEKRAEDCHRLIIAEYLIKHRGAEVNHL